MNYQEIYFLLFVDSLVANLAFNTSFELIIHGMKIFAYNPYLVIIVASAGFFTANLINYFLGQIIYRILITTGYSPDNPDNMYYSTYSKLFTLTKMKYFSWIFILAVIPVIGKFIVVLASFWQIRFLPTILITTIAKIGYYFYIMLS